MIPGTILLHYQFQFDDGESKDKFLIVLNDGEHGQYLCALVTSKQHNKGTKYGCQDCDRPPNFFLPVHSTPLKKNSWVLFDRLLTYQSDDLKQKVVNGKALRFAILAPNIVDDLIDCASDSDDILDRERDILIDMLTKGK